jgi:hypothetical protein
MLIINAAYTISLQTPSMYRQQLHYLSNPTVSGLERISNAFSVLIRKVSRLVLSVIRLIDHADSTLWLMNITTQAKAFAAFTVRNQRAWIDSS